MIFHSNTVYCIVLLNFLSFLLFFCHAEATKKGGESTDEHMSGRREVKPEFDPLDTFSPINFNSIRLDLSSNAFTEPAILFSIADSLEYTNQDQDQDETNDQTKEQAKKEQSQREAQSDINNIILSIPEVGLGMNKGNGTISTSTSSSSSGLRTNDPEFTKMVSIVAFFAILFIGIFAWLFSKHCCFRPKSLTSGDPNCPRTRAALPLSPQFNFMGVQVIRRFNNPHSQVPTPEKPDDLPPKYEDLFPEDYSPDCPTHSEAVTTSISEASSICTTRQTNPDSNSIMISASTSASTSASSKSSDSKNDESAQS